MRRIKQLNNPAPIAKRVEHIATHHGKKIKDSYAWLKDENYPNTDNEEILAYLKAENAYFDEFKKPHQDFIDKIFTEFKGRTDETEESVPYIDNDYEYQSKYAEGQEYPVHSRQHIESRKTDIFLDENALADGKDYFVIGDFDISEDNQYLAYSFDANGDERYQVRI